MKIKLHKRFRGLLSLLVTVMLLVGIMPTQVWQGITASAVEYVTVYFDKDGHLEYPVYGNDGLKKGTNQPVWWTSQVKHEKVYIHTWNTGGTNVHDVKMEWDNNTQSMKYTFEIGAGQTFTTKPDYMIFFSRESDNDTYGWHEKTADLPFPSDNDRVYYFTASCSSHGSDTTLKSSSKNLSECYIPLSVKGSSYFNATKDMNVLVDNVSEPKFSKDPERHYVSATLYDYFSDYEIQSGTTRTGGNQADVAGQGILTAYNWTDAERRVQHLTFSKALSNYYASVNSNYQRPLYFGDMHHESDESYNFRSYNVARHWGLLHNSTTNSDDAYKQLYHDNNSLRRAGTELSDKDKAIPNVATTGLYANNINSSTAYNASASNTTNAKRLALTGGASAKWFDSDWLETNNSTGHMIGASYDVDFPFWTKTAQRTINGKTWASCNYFYIDSEDPDHALRLHKENGTNKYYLKETKQGIYNFTGNDAKIFEAIQNNTAIPALNTTYGFFPFNSKSDFYDSSINNYDNLERADLKNLMDYQLRYDRTNYAFGTYMVIPFELNAAGTMYGTTDNNVDTPITFTFSGDDDLLVYVDGQLVLDIGGNHGKVEGEINFNLQKSWVSRVKSTEHNDGGATYGDNGEANAGDKYGYFTQNATLSRDLKTFSDVKNSGDGVRDISSVCGAGSHTMEIFYVERGDFDSNMEIMYNLPVVDDRSFTVDQNITYPTVDSVFTDSANYTNNLNKIKIGTNVQFSLPTDTGNFSTLLGSQTYHGDHPNKYTFNSNNLYHQTFGTAITGSGSVANTYTAPMGNNQTLTYVNDFIKPYNYNLRVSEGNIFIGSTDTGQTVDIDTGQTVDYLFTTNWTLSLLSSSTPTNTGSDAGPATTSTSSRPKRATKTTSTSANNNSNGFDFRGTTDHPDEVVFNNTMQTYTLQIKKNFTRKDGDTAAHTFTFDIEFDNVGGLNLEEPNAPTAGSIELSKTGSVTYNANESGEKPVATIVVPARTQYKVTEQSGSQLSGYVVGGQQTSYAAPENPGTFTVTITNSPDTDVPPPETFKIRVQSYFTQSNSAQTGDVPSDIKLQLQKSTDSGATWANEGSDVTVSNISTDSNGRKYFEELLTGTYEYNASHMYRILEYNSSNAPITNGGYDTVFTVLSGNFTNNSDEKKSSRPASEFVEENNVKVLTLSLLNAGPVPVALKIQKVWGTTNVYPDSVKISVERSSDGSTWEYVDNNFIGFDGTQLTADNHMITLTDTQSVTVTNGDISNVIWGAYLFNESDKDIDNNGNVYQYRITEYTSAGVKVNDGDIFYFDNNNDTVMFSAGYTPAAFAPGYLNTYSGQTEPTPNNSNTFASYENTYGDSTAHTLRAVPLSIINSPIPDPDVPDTGRRGIYMPVMFGFAVILVAVAGYFVYRRKVAA